MIERNILKKLVLFIDNIWFLMYMILCYLIYIKQRNIYDTNNEINI